MALKAWRESNGKSLEECAKLFGVANGTVVWRWEAGIAVPRRHQMIRVYVETKGAVTPNDFYDLPPLPALPARAELPQEIAA